MDERLKSKKWNVRGAAYDELAASDEILDYGGQIKGYLSDANPAALQKAYEVVIAYVKKAR